MGNLFSSEDDEQKTYTLKDLNSLKDELGRIYFKDTEDELESEFTDLYYNSSNITNVSEFNRLGKYFNDIESNLQNNYESENWLETQLKTDLLDNNVLKVNFNSVLPINYDEHSYLLDLVKSRNSENVKKSEFSKDNGIVNNDNNVDENNVDENNVDENNVNDNNVDDNNVDDNNNDNNVDDDEEENKRIVELYKGVSSHIFKDATISGRPSYGKVNISDVKLGLRNGELVLCSEYNDSFSLSSSLTVEWYFMVLNDGSRYVVFDNYYFNGSENDYLLEYDNQFVSLLYNANQSLNNNNLREVKSFKTKFNRYLQTLEKVDENQLVVLLGDTIDGNLIDLENFIDNFEFDI